MNIIMKTNPVYCFLILTFFSCSSSIQRNSEIERLTENVSSENFVEETSNENKNNRSSEKDEDGVYFHNSEHGYSLKIPKGWVQMSQAEVDKLIKRSGNQAKYEEGFYPAKFLERDRAVDEMVYPYVLTTFGAIQLHSDQYEELANKMMSNSMIRRAVDRFDSKEAREIVEKVEIGEGFYDKTNQRLIMKMETDIEGVGKTYGISTFIFSQKGILALHFWDLESGFNKNVDSVYSDLISSVKFN